MSDSPTSADNDEGDEARIIDLFAVVGLPETPTPELAPQAPEVGGRSAPLAPITDITVIFPTLGERVPEGYEVLEYTPTGLVADLNHGTISRTPVFLAFKRGYHKSPLVDIGVLDEGKNERPMPDSHIVTTTPFGRTANVNNTAQNIFLTYRRAPRDASPTQLVVTHLCVIVTSRGEHPPHTFYKIPKNLNKGFVGSDVFICYKKSEGTSKRIAHEAAVLDCWPRERTRRAEQLRRNVPMFCQPMGALIECWPARCHEPDKQFSTFVLTDESGTKYYGASVMFHEKWTGELTDEQREKLELPSISEEEEKNAAPLEETGVVPTDSLSNNDPAEQWSLYTNVSICVVSRFPFFASFRRILYHLHRLVISRVPTAVPIERLVSHLMYEVPMPGAGRPRVLTQLGQEIITFEALNSQQLPLSGAWLSDALKVMGVENLMYLQLLALLEHKILVHSLRPWLLTAVAESARALLFPLHWQCPYIPQCPLALAGVLHAPLPFIAGVDSRYFDLFEEPPADVTCFDLDTQTVSLSEVRSSVKLSMLPRKPTKQLRITLEAILNQLRKQDFETSNRRAEYMPVEAELEQQARKRALELQVRDAFLRWMARLLRGYEHFLKPIVTRPTEGRQADAQLLFDRASFLKTRDRHSTEFYRRLVETQSWIRFIEERSLPSDQHHFHAFFDDCVARLDAAADDDEMSLVADSDLAPSSVGTASGGNMDGNGGGGATQHTFVPPPEPLVDEQGNECQFVYTHFPRRLQDELFDVEGVGLRADPSRAKGRPPAAHHADYSRCTAVRTKPELRSSLRAITRLMRSSSLAWPRCVLHYVYSLWFAQFPSVMAQTKRPRHALEVAFDVLARMEASGAPLLDQVCCRVLADQCGRLARPHAAVRLLRAIQRWRTRPNAVTYGVYHRAVMRGEHWPSAERLTAIAAWRRLRLVIVAASAIKKKIRIYDDQVKPFRKRVAKIAARAAASQAALQQTPVRTTTGRSQRANHQGVKAPDEKSQQSEDLDDEDTAEEEEEQEEEPVENGNEDVDQEEKKEKIRMPPPKQIPPPRPPPPVVTTTTTAATTTTTMTTPTRTPTTTTATTGNSGGGWFKAVTSSPLFRIVKSHTFESDSSPMRSSTLPPQDSTKVTPSSASSGPYHISSAALSVAPSSAASAALVSSMSPSLTQLVSSVRQRVDDVKFLRDGLKAGVSSLVGSLSTNGGGQIESDEDGDDPGSVGARHRSGSVAGTSQVVSTGAVDEADPLYVLDKGRAPSLHSPGWLNELYLEAEEEEKTQDDEEDAGWVLDVSLCARQQCPHCETALFEDDVLLGWPADEQHALTVACVHCDAAMQVGGQDPEAASTSSAEQDGGEDGSGKSKLNPPPSAQGSQRGSSASLQQQQQQQQKQPLHHFVPHLHVGMEWRRKPVAESFYRVEGRLQTRKKTRNEDDESPTTPRVSPQPQKVTLLSPLVLRRQLELLLAEDVQALAHVDLLGSRPELFWNLLYWTRRVSLPTPLSQALRKAHGARRLHVRCVWDRADFYATSDYIPLYVLNPNKEVVAEEVKMRRDLKVWHKVVDAIQEGNVFKATEALIADCRRSRGGQGGGALRPHFPFFRDIQLCGVDHFGRSFQLDALDVYYVTEWERLPPFVRNNLPLADRPQRAVGRACRKVFLPLDLL